MWESRLKRWWWSFNKDFTVIDKMLHSMGTHATVACLASPAHVRGFRLTAREGRVKLAITEYIVVRPPPPPPLGRFWAKYFFKKG